jgi:hypothetical protein
MIVKPAALIGGPRQIGHRRWFSASDGLGGRELVQKQLNP